jgi:hypothetical protein
MYIYRFKVWFEDDESIVREIEIKSVQTFEDFQKIIQTSIGFDDIHPASFYITNDTWRKGKQIKLLRFRENKASNGLWMHDLKLATYVEDPHQKYIYEYDPDGGAWVLFCELVKILPDEANGYPRITKKTGDAPEQYKTNATDKVLAEEEEEAPALLEIDSYISEPVAEYAEAGKEDEEIPMVAAIADGEEIKEADEEEDMEEESNLEDEGDFR